MFCPNCGTSNSTDQNFCRSCGISLEEISHALTAQVRGTALADPKETALEVLGRVGLFGLGGVSLIGVGALIYTILMQFILSGSNIAGGIFIIAFIVFASLSLAYVIRRESLKEKHDKKRLAVSETFEESPTTQLAGENTEQPASITEGTTRQLK